MHNADYDPFELLPELDESRLLPPYLRESASSLQTHGTLSFQKKTRQWVLRGDPSVCLMAKRLFPSATGRGKTLVRLPATLRTAGDLNWLMLRYPLSIAPADRAAWEDALEKARAAAVERAQVLQAPADLAPGPDAFEGELLPFQKEGLRYLRANARALLADEMGLGKTVQALAFLAMHQRWPVLVVVPPHLMMHWKREAERFLRRGGRPPAVHLISGLTPYPLPEAQLYVVHYLLLRGWKEALSSIHWPAVLLDEVQELRHSGTEKYSAASLIAEGADRAVGLSGTPIYNRGGEIWNVINILDFHALGDFDSFTRQWCSGYGRDLVTKPEQLGEYLRAEGLLFRRTKEEVLDQLPPKRRLVEEIGIDSEIYRGVLQPALQQMPRLREELSDFDRARIEDEICRAERQATGLGKAPFVAAFVRSLLEAGESVLLFAHHHAVMNAYRDALAAYSPVFVTGRETLQEKEKSIAAFMAGETNLCCVSLRAASGLNLQRARCVVFGELDWSPAVHSQAEDRAHRIGQRDSVLCYYLVSPKGSDREMQEALGLKVSQFTLLMGDRVATQEESFLQQVEARSFIRKVVERLYRSEKGEDPDAPQIRDPDAP